MIQTGTHKHEQNESESLLANRHSYYHICKRCRRWIGGVGRRDDERHVDEFIQSTPSARSLRNLFPKQTGTHKDENESKKRCCCSTRYHRYHHGASRLYYIDVGQPAQNCHT